MGVQRTQRGVGGFRPMVNWREISVRRKNVANKQVLVCVTGSGIVIVILGVVFTILGFLVISSECPFMWEEGPGACYYLARHNASWSSGKHYCHSQSATLLHLHSDTQSDLIRGVMLGPSWLGLHRGQGQQEWLWLSGAKFNYTRWHDPASLPDDTSTSYCAVVGGGIVNYGFGHSEIDRTAECPPAEVRILASDSGPSHDSGPSASAASKDSWVRKVESHRDLESASAPVVHVAPVDMPPTPSLTIAPTEDRSRSQEQLELLLSPKTLV
nr:low affinity immunoglobulin epsilon Fc receptor-like [Cherax quadricarinatus]